MRSVIRYLRDLEWSMGNGQCHDCGGKDPGRWEVDHPCYTLSGVGHQPGCKLGGALEDLGMIVDWAHCSLKAKPAPLTPEEQEEQYQFLDSVFGPLIEKWLLEKETPPR